MTTKTELKLAEVIGYLKSASERPENFGLLCNFFRDLPYDKARNGCEGCIFYINGNCFIHIHERIANRMLQAMERKNKFKLDDAYKNGVAKYE